ncbi:hypothetical protein COLO4_31511 [Corchorus olitorius]|uniref:Uncharacterized protein n=1 Tax=Corchorus olitorius TaxID=93759 RepID=A0A1R3H472_9ROSI|nr:hypothetical protein COLO4_31511 [Corchorus olitorius]
MAAKESVYKLEFRHWEPKIVRKRGGLQGAAAFIMAI